ncbi:MAG: hypothetical protein CL846_03820 [Crocinitomicaceae bacterium]|nr:hypothetical protein [Crocinitomicaceae bacterium]
MCLKIDPLLAFVGAIAFGFSSYFLIIIGAGHNTKVIAIAYMSPVIGGLVLAYGKRLFLGAAIMTLFLSLQINANHPQVTYYLFILLFFIVIQQFISAFKQKEIKRYIKKSSFLLVGILLGISTNIPNLYGTYEYSPYTQRGGTELSIGKENTGKSKSSMSKDYALQWSYGKQESLSFLVPNIKGGASGKIADDAIIKDKTNKYQELKDLTDILGISLGYFGNQASTSGPVYMGAIICFLFVLGLIFVKNPIKWPLLFMSILSLLLSWGSNYPFLTDFFWEYMPAYNKFRAVTIILVMVQLVFPLLGCLWLKEVFEEKDYFSKKINPFFHKKEFLRSKVMLWSSSIFLGVLLLITFFSSSFISLTSEKDKIIFDDPSYLNNQLTNLISNNKNIDPKDSQNIIDQNFMILSPKLDKAKSQLIEYRSEVIKQDGLRSFLFIVMFIVIFYFFSKNKINKKILITSLGVLIICDLWFIDQRYLNNEKDSKGNYQHWVEKEIKDIPYLPSNADIAIYKNEIKLNPDLGDTINKKFIDFKNEKGEVNKRENYSFKFGKLNQNTNYRVLLFDPYFLKETSISYFHKSLGGYNSTKIQRFQDLLDHKFSSPTFSKLINMLNTKYLIYNPNSSELSLNNEAMGNAWFVNEVKAFSSPDEEFNELDRFDEKNTAITDSTYHVNSSISKSYSKNDNASILMTSYKPNEIKYSLNNINGGEHFVVFSEIYYPLGWKAYIDGVPTDISRVNYFLRGLKVPEGTKNIDLVYELKSFKVLSNIALASSSLIILLVLGCIYLSLYKKKDF